MKLPTGGIVVLTALVTFVVVTIVAGVILWSMAGSEITYAITHRGETQMCRENLQKALNSPLLQPVINSQK